MLLGLVQFNNSLFKPFLLSLSILAKLYFSSLLISIIQLVIIVIFTKCNNLTLKFY